MLFEVAGVPAYQKLQEIVAAMPPEGQLLALRGLHIGVTIDEYADSHERGDLLIRGVLGGDERARSAWSPAATTCTASPRRCSPLAGNV